MNLRGKFTTDANGRIWFRTIKPIGYPIPLDGPTGDLLRGLRRHNLRPAHLHFLIAKEGYKAHISQVYSSDDPNLETDSQFGVTERLIGHYVRHENEPAPYGRREGPVVLAVVHVRSRRRRAEAAAPADQQQIQEPAAEDRAARARISLPVATAAHLPPSSLQHARNSMKKRP